MLAAAQRDAPCRLPALPDAGAWLRVVALDVGQGDATLIRFPDGTTLARRRRRRPRPAAASTSARGSSRRRCGRRACGALDALLLTHADADHVGGAAGLIPLVPPARVWEGVPVAGLPVLDVVRRAAAAVGRRVGRGRGRPARPGRRRRRPRAAPAGARLGAAPSTQRRLDRARGATGRGVA